MLLQPFAVALVCATPLSPTIQNRGDVIVSISPSVLPCGVALVSQTPGQGAKDSVPALGTQGAQCWQVAPAVPCTTGQLYQPHHHLLSFEQQINLDQNQKELWPQP